MEKENSEVLITAQGSLAILALGSVGIKKWREVIKERKEIKKDSNGDGKKNN